MKKILLVLINVFLLTSINAQWRTNSEDQRKLLRNVLTKEKVNDKWEQPGQMYYDIISTKCAFATTKEIKDFTSYNSKTRLRFISHVSAFYFYEKRDTLWIHINSKYDRKLKKVITDKHKEVFNYYDMDFYVVDSLWWYSVANKGEVRYYGENEKYIKKGYYTIEVDKNSDDAQTYWISIFPTNIDWVGEDVYNNSPAIVFEVNKNTMVLDENFWKVSDKWIRH
jgi:hypothetical protein